MRTRGVTLFRGSNLMPKDAKTYDEQLDILILRGLIVGNPGWAKDWLQHHNYYRLSAYRFPFTVAGDADTFLPKTKLEQLADLYSFDMKLRQLVFEGCGKVEISVRARWAYEFGHQLGPLEYLNNQHFRDPLVHARTLSALSNEMNRSTEEFIKHHRRHLQEPWPPVWVICEIASFGTVSKLLANTQPPRLRQDIADTYGLDEKTFCSLIHHVAVLRNMAAHHARIWNRRLTFTVQLPRKKPDGLSLNFYIDPSERNSKTRKIYNSLVLLVYMTLRVEPNGSWPKRLLAHLNTLEPTLIPAMGFPGDWKTRSIWKNL